MVKERKKNKRTLKGTVVSDKNDKTVIVSVTAFKKHAKYGKFIKTNKRYKAHDESNKYKEGDKVTIRECAPRSKDKKFIVVL